MKIHNIVPFLLVGLSLATATRPPYGSGRSSTSAKAQVGKAILVRIPLDSDSPQSSQQYQGDYHEPISSTKAGGKYQGYGYEPKEEPETRNYNNPESRPASISDSIPKRRHQGYGVSTNPSLDVDPRQKMVLLVPEENKETPQGYNTPAVSSYNRQPASHQTEEVYSKPTQGYNNPAVPSYGRQPVSHQTEEVYSKQTQGYNNPAVPSYGRQQVTQQSEEIVYSKPLSPSGTKFQEKKNQYQSHTSNKEHHKVPLILITLNKEEKLAVKPTPASRRIPPGYGKSWQPMINTESRPIPAQPQQQRSNSYDDSPRVNQQSTYKVNEWQQDQPIRQESHKQEISTVTTTNPNQWQSDNSGAQYDRPLRNQQSTEERYNQYKEQVPESAVNKNYNRNNYGSQQTYGNNQEHSQTNQDIYPQQYPRSYQVGLTESKPQQQPAVQSEQQSYQGNYYQRDNQQETRFPQSNQESRYPQTTQETNYQQSNVESRYPQQNQDSRYQQTNADSSYPQQTQESKYPQTNYPQQTQESTTRYPLTNYPQQTQEPTSRYQQDNQESRYPQQTQESTTRYQQDKQESRYPQQTQESTSRYQQDKQESRYPQQTQESTSRYQQENQESRYPEVTQDTRYTQTNQESRYPQQTQESSRYQQQTNMQDNRYPQQSHESSTYQPIQDSRYPQENQEQRYPQNNQDSRLTYTQNSEDRYPQENTGYNSAVRSNQDQTQVKQETQVPAVSSVKTPWRQASPYVTEQVESTRTSTDYEKPVRSNYNQGYSAQPSGGSRRGEDSWEPQASSERTVKTRGERTKGVVLLLLSNDDKDGYARRSSEAEPTIPAIPSTV